VGVLGNRCNGSVKHIGVLTLRSKIWKTDLNIFNYIKSKNPKRNKICILKRKNETTSILRVLVCMGSVLAF
jgi:hypothetical protein